MRVAAMVVVVTAATAGCGDNNALDSCQQPLSVLAEPSEEHSNLLVIDDSVYWIEGARGSYRLERRSLVDDDRRTLWTGSMPAVFGSLETDGSRLMWPAPLGEDRRTALYSLPLTGGIADVVTTPIGDCGNVGLVRTADAIYASVNCDPPAVLELSADGAGTGLWSGTSGIEDLAATADSLYFAVVGTGVYRFRRGTDEALLISQRDVSSLAVHEDRLFLTAYDTIYSVASDGTAEDRVTSGETPPRALVVGSDGVFFATKRHVYRTPLDGGGIRVLARLPDDTYVVDMSLTTDETSIVMQSNRGPLRVGTCPRD